MKLFVVSIERGTSRRVYHRRPWLSDMSQLGGAPLSVPCASWLWHASVCRTEARSAHFNRRLCFETARPMR